MGNQNNEFNREDYINDVVMSARDSAHEASVGLLHAKRADLNKVLADLKEATRIVEAVIVIEGLWEKFDAENAEDETAAEADDSLFGG